MDSVVEFIESVPQRGLFVGKHLFQATSMATAFGLVFGAAGASLGGCGPIPLYLVGSCMGFGIASVRTWFGESFTAKHYAKEYPSVMQHHKRVQYPAIADSIITDVAACKPMSFSATTWLILVAQTAAKDIEEIEARRMSDLADRLFEKYTQSQD